MLLACEDSEPSKSTLDRARDSLLAGRYLEAKEKYELYLQRNKQGAKRWKAWNRLLFINSKLGSPVQRKVEVLETMYMEFGQEPEKARQLLPLLAETYGEELANHEQAQEFWKDYLDICSDDASCRFEANWGLAQTYFQMGDFPSARDCLRSCLQLTENLKEKYRCQYKIARSFILEGDRQQAITWLQKVAKSKSENDIRAKAVFELADLYTEQEKYAKAKDLLQSILDKHPNPKLVEVKLKHIKEKLEN